MHDTFVNNSRFAKIGFEITECAKMIKPFKNSRVLLTKLMTDMLFRNYVPGNMAVS